MKNKRNIADFNRVKTSTEFDVNEVVTKEVEEAISKVVDNCSKKYHRNIDVLFTVEMD